MTLFGVSVSSLIWRFVRAVVMLAATAYWHKHQGDTLAMVAAGPTALTISKFLRDKYPGKLEWLPV